MIDKQIILFFISTYLPFASKFLFQVFGYNGRCLLGQVRLGLVAWWLDGLI